MSEDKLTMAELTNKVNEKLKDHVSTGTDARYSSTLSERRVKDYITKGILDKPFGAGKEKWFGELHVNKLFALRQLQSDGLSDQYLKKLSGSSSPALPESNFAGISGAGFTGAFEASSFSANTEQSFSLSDHDDAIIENEEMRKSALSFIENMNNKMTQTKIHDSKAARSSSLLGSMAIGAVVGSSASTSNSMFLQNYYSSTEDTAKLQAVNTLKKQVSKVWNEYQLDDEGKVFLKIEGNTKVKNGKEILNQIKSILNIQGEKND